MKIDTLAVKQIVVMSKWKIKVQKLENLSATQIFREINFGQFRELNIVVMKHKNNAPNHIMTCWFHEIFLSETKFLVFPQCHFNQHFRKLIFQTFSPSHNNKLKLLSSFSSHIGKLLAHFLQCIQFNMHMVESGFSNRLICLDSETRIWKFADKFCIGEFIETTPLGGAIYPTLANVNHSCDPNFTIVNYGKRAVAVAVRRIKAGMEIHDSYGAVWYHMERSERQRFLKVSVLDIFLLTQCLDARSKI